MVFSGSELGAQIVTGLGFQTAPPSPMRRAYELAYNSINVGRPSWDQTAVLYAVRGADAGFSLVTGGHNHVLPDGRNEWRTDRVAKHAYLTLAAPATTVAATIEALMLQPPRR
jgi:hypothetical protein